jgi:hypothetical protein
MFKPRKANAESISSTFEGTSFNSINNSFREKMTEKKLKRDHEAALELSEIFKKLAVERKRPTVARIFQVFLSSKHFVDDANYLYNMFHFKLKTELSLEQLIEILNKRVIKRPSFLKKRNLSVVFNSEKKDEEVNFRRSFREMDAFTALKLEKIFDRFDTNKDGEVDYKELKTGLKEDFDKVVIRDLFKNHVRKGKSSLGIKEFIELFAPANVEVTAESLRHLQSRLK